ncbi:hypothetical protein BZA77DRAFT_377975 [Pyronema omphalodes]|nr:hypothetical protein BZA77DRAFT_377975 [Pyronema omphalodes]
MFPSNSPYSQSPPDSLSPLAKSMSLLSSYDSDTGDSAAYYTSAESSANSVSSSTSFIFDFQPSPKLSTVTATDPTNRQCFSNILRPSKSYSIEELHALRPHSASNSSPLIPSLLRNPEPFSQLSPAELVVDDCVASMEIPPAMINPDSGFKNNMEHLKEYHGNPIILGYPEQYTSSKGIPTTYSLSPNSSRLSLGHSRNPSPTGPMGSFASDTTSCFSTPGGGPSDVPTETPLRKSRESRNDSSQRTEDIYTCLCGDWGVGQHDCSFYVSRKQATTRRITGVLENRPYVEPSPSGNSANMKKEAIKKDWKSKWNEVVNDIIEYESKLAETMQNENLQINDDRFLENMGRAVDRLTGDYQANYQGSTLQGSYFPVMEDVWDSDEEEMPSDDCQLEALWEDGVDWVDDVMSR